MDGQTSPSLTNSSCADVELPSSEKEVYSTMQKCCSEKAPRQGGMTMALIQDIWHTFKPNTSRMFTEFHYMGAFVKSLNASFIRTLRIIVPSA